MHPDVEEQFILRLPPDLAEKMRSAIRKGKQDLGMELHMEDKKHGVLHMGDQKHKVVVAELPTIVESQKTLNNATYYKSADIHQVLVVLEPGQELPKGTESNLSMKHGLTPPTRNSRRRFVRGKPKINLTAVETELLKIMRRNALYDNGTERIELIDGSDYEDEVEQPEQSGEKDTAERDAESSETSSKKKKKKKKDGKEGKEDKEKKRKKEKKKKSEAATPQADTTSAAATPGPATPAPLTPAASLTASAIYSPVPTPNFAALSASQVSVASNASAPAPAPSPVLPPVLPLPLSLTENVVDLPELQIAQLQAEHRALTAEVSDVRARMVDAQAKAAASSNVVMKMRYETALAESHKQFTALTMRLNEITEELRRLGGML